MPHAVWHANCLQISFEVDLVISQNPDPAWFRKITKMKLGSLIWLGPCCSSVPFCNPISFDHHDWFDLFSIDYPPWWWKRRCIWMLFVGCLSTKLFFGAGLLYAGHLSIATSNYGCNTHWRSSFELILQLLEWANYKSARLVFLQNMICSLVHEQTTVIWCTRYRCYTCCIYLWWRYCIV